MGVNLPGRIGFGDVVSREWREITTGADALGTLPSIIASRARAVYQRAQHGQPGMAAVETLPYGIRNPLKAGVEAERGIRSLSGKTVLPASKIITADTVKRALGFQSMDET